MTGICFYGICIQHPTGAQTSSGEEGETVTRFEGSPYPGPGFLMKKPDGCYRLQTDFRKIDAHIIRCLQPIPGFEEMVAHGND